MDDSFIFFEKQPAAFTSMRVENSLFTNPAKIYVRQLVFSLKKRLSRKSHLDTNTV